ncbi:MAG: NTP transferase domain-containing protein [Dysosmobacter sp.]
MLVSQYPEILSLAGEYGFEAVWNDQPDLGLSRSVRLGLEQLTDCGGVLFLVADQPWLKRDSVEALAALWAPAPSEDRCHGPRRCPGQSLPLPRSVLPGASGLNGDRGGSAVIRNHEADLILLETDALELTDIDHSRRL